MYIGRRIPRGGSYGICCMACFDTSGIFSNETPEPVFRACVAIYLFWHILIRLGHLYPTGFFPKSFPYCKPESNRMKIIYFVPSSSLESTWRFRKGKLVCPPSSWVALQPSQQPGPTLHRSLGNCSPTIQPLASPSPP
jgi:hypothetical protein